MAIEQSGYKLVLQGYQQFISGLGKIASDSAKMGREMESAAKRVDSAGTKLANSQARYASAVRNAERASNHLKIAELALATATERSQRAEEKRIAVFDDATSTIDERTRASIKALELQRLEERAQYDVANAGLTVTQTKEKEADATQALLNEVAKYLSVADDASSATMATAAGMGQLGVVLGVVTAAIGLAVAAFQTMVDIIGKVYNAVKNLIEKGINLLTGAIKTLGNIVNSVLKPIGDILKTAFGVAGGIALIDTIRGIGQAFNNLLSSLKEVLSHFQRLNIQLEALQARDIAHKTGMSMGESFFFASGKAKELLDWIIQLAVTTPFTVEQLSETLAMANAMGLNITMAKELTQAVGNFTSAMGLTHDHMFRIVYNFGQMLAQGKLNGREFRDLANSFVPVWQMLDRMAKKTNLTTEEFKKLAFEGGVPVQAFFKEFIRMANEDFPGAMAKMARTFEGVINNTKDFIQTVIGMNALGPVFNYWTGKAADILERLLSPAVRDAAEALGKMLLVSVKELEAAFNRLWVSLGDVAKAVGITGLTFNKFAIAIRVAAFYISKVFDAAAVILTKNAQGIAGIFQNLSNNAMTWGRNLVVAFANGMASAISFIATVINKIVSLISWFLEAFSPPRALPDLPKWGMNAMRSYLEGFTQADFSALDGIQGPMEQALSILERTGEIGKGQLGIIYRDISMAIAEFIATGEGQSDLLEMIEDQLGPFGDDIANLALLELELAEATQMVVEAEKALKEAQEAEQRARRKVSAEIRKYNNLLTAGADRAILDAQLAVINADEDAARAATEQRVAAEEQLAAAQEMMEALREQVELQAALVQQLLDITEKQIMEIDVVVDTTGAGEAIADMSDLFDEAFGEGPTSFGGRIQRTFSAVRDKWSELEVEMAIAIQNAEKKWEDFWLGLEDLADTSGITTKFEELKTSLGELATKAQEFWDALSGKKKLPGQKGPGDVIPISVEMPTTNLDKIKGFLQSIAFLADLAWRRLKNVGEGLSIIADSFTRITGIKVNDPLALFLDLILRLILPISAVIGILDNFVTTMANVWFVVAEAKDIISAKWEEIVQVFSQKVAEIKIIIGAWITEQAINIQNSAINIFNILSAKWEEIKTAIGQKTTEILMNIGAWLLNTWMTISTKMGEIWTVITTKWEEIKTEWARITGLIKDKVKEIFESPATSIVEIIKTAIDSIEEFFKVTLPNAFNNFITGALQNLFDKIDDLVEKLKKAWEWLKKVWNKGGGGGGGDDDEPVVPGGADQFGGRVQKGKAYIVGERGWEYFFPGISGWIANQQQVAKMVSKSMMRNVATIPRINAQPVMSQNVLNFSMGGVAVYSPMTLAQVESIVTNVIRREFS